MQPSKKNKLLEKDINTTVLRRGIETVAAETSHRQDQFRCCVHYPFHLNWCTIKIKKSFSQKGQENFLLGRFLAPLQWSSFSDYDYLGNNLGTMFLGIDGANLQEVLLVW